MAQRTAVRPQCDVLPVCDAGKARLIHEKDLRVCISLRKHASIPLSRKIKCRTRKRPFGWYHARHTMSSISNLAKTLLAH